MLIFEDLASTPRHRLFTWLGVEWQATPRAWLCVPWFLTIGGLVAWAADAHAPPGANVIDGLGFGSLLFLMNVLHSAGHTISARLAGSAPGTVLVTATFHVNAHRCVPGVCSPLVHIERSLGGPIANLLTGRAALAANAAVGSRGLDFFAKASLIVGVWTALPIPGFDGWVIWGELFGFRRRRV